MYVVGKEVPMRFLQNRRALSSVLSKHSTVAARFRSMHGDRFTTVRDYYEFIAHQVEIVDLANIVPAFGSENT